MYPIGQVSDEEVFVAIEEGVAHPGNTEDAHHGVHAGSEDSSLGSCGHIAYPIRRINAAADIITISIISEVAIGVITPSTM